MEIDELFTEEQVVEVSDKILTTILEKIKKELTEVYYNEMQNYLYEHYRNASDEIQNKLISKITDEFINDPKKYKFIKLREKIFEENKETLIPLLTNEVIENSIDKILFGNKDEDCPLRWRWEEGIARIIVENIDKLLKNKKINNSLLAKINILQNQSAYYLYRIRELEEENN